MDLTSRMDRRSALKWVLAASASATLWHTGGSTLLAGIFPPPAQGYGTDPKLNASYQPGDFWPLTLTEPQRRLVAHLCDVILPADADAPAASALKVHDFVDEWVSAPYAAQKADREVIVAGLAWVVAQCKEQFDAEFRDLTEEQKTTLCDRIALVEKARPEDREAAVFFGRLRELACAGYYTTPQGMKAIGYVGNVPLATFDGPPPELLAKLGLA